MTVALASLLLGLLLLAAGVGYEIGWGWTAAIVGAGLLAAGLLYDVDKPDREAA